MLDVLLMLGLAQIVSTATAIVQVVLPAKLLIEEKFVLSQAVVIIIAQEFLLGGAVIVGLLIVDVIIVVYLLAAAETEEMAEKKNLLLAEEARLVEAQEAVMLKLQHILGVAGALIMRVRELLIQLNKQEQEAVILEEILAEEAINVQEVQVIQEYAQ